GERVRAGLEHADVRVLPDGEVAACPGSAPPPVDEPHPGQDLQAVGRLVCAALGVDVEPDPQAPFAAAESVALPLVVLARAMAMGALGADVEAAARTYAERAGRLATPERLECSREELAALVGRLLQSGGQPAVVERPPGLGLAPPGRALPARHRAGRRPPLAALGAVAVLAGIAGLAGLGLFRT